MLKVYQIKLEANVERTARPINKTRKILWYAVNAQNN